MAGMKRIAVLRNELDWSQARLGAYLGLNASQISRMENGQEETGPVRRLLDILARDNGRADLTAERFRVPPEAGAA